MTEPVFDPRVCAVCDSRAAATIFEHRGAAFTSDGRTVPQDVQKVQCDRCGAVRRGNAFDPEALHRHYARDYELARRARQAEPRFYRDGAAIPRSQALFEWLHDAVVPALSAPPRTLLDVGCGEGTLLRRMAAAFPGARVAGIDPGFDGAGEGLDIQRGSYAAVAGAFDLVYSVAVIEHVASPRHFLGVLGGALAPSGVLAVALPNLAARSRDLLFCDHLHHLNAEHMASMAAGAGLAEVGRRAGPAELAAFALYLYRPAPAGSPAVAAPDPAPAVADVRAAIADWTARVAALDRWLAAHAHRRLLVWGLGEAFGLLRTYSALGRCRIDRGLDDNPERFRGDGWSFGVDRLEDAADLGDAPVVLLTFAPSPSAVARLQARQLQWFSPLSHEGNPWSDGSRSETSSRASTTASATSS